jgi:hypothetical protein
MSRRIFAMTLRFFVGTHAALRFNGGWRQTQARQWVVIDDDRMAIEEVLDTGRCVFTNPTCGLTDEDAERAAYILGAI